MAKHGNKKRNFREFLDYYEAHKIIPTVDITDLNSKILRNQRFNLYAKIGVYPVDFKDKEIIEFCPGTGHNAFYLLKHCNIKNISLVDFNSSSIKKLKINLRKFHNKKIINKDIKYFNSKKKFDYVIMENAIQGFDDPVKIFNKIINFLNPNGKIIITLTDNIGIFADKIKYFYALLRLSEFENNDFKKKLSFLTKIFKTHLKFLGRDTRKPEKWVLDIILNEHWITKNKYFGLQDIFKLLKKNNLLINSTSPKFHHDFSWYKHVDFENHNKIFLHSYFKTRLNFVDFQEKFTDNSMITKKISVLIKTINRDINKLKINSTLKDKDIKIIYYKLKILSSLFNKLKKKNKISLALNELNNVILSFLKKKRLNKNTNQLKRFWGKTTTLICLYKPHFNIN